MKKSIISLLLFISFMSFRFITDELSKYAVNTSELKEKVQELATLDNFPSFRFYITPEIKKIGLKLPAAEQATMAKAVGMFVKNYVGSVAFKADFEKTLDAKKESTDPNAPSWKEEYGHEYSRNFSEHDEMVKSGILSDDYFDIIKQMRDNFKVAAEKPNPYGEEPAGKTMYDIEMGVAKRGLAENEAILAIRPLLKSNKTDFTKKLAGIKAKYAIEGKIEETARKNQEIEAKKNYKPNIKAQLQQYLDETADVDFGAKLFRENNHDEFVNEEYRQKSFTWKQSFRIGKSGTMVFREIAEQWIKEL